MKQYLFLLLAICAETFATSYLKESRQFTRFWPSAVTVLGYAVAFYFLSLVLKTMPVGIAYALWSGIGIVLISLIGHFAFRQHLDLPAVIGSAPHCVVIINLFPKPVSHRAVRTLLKPDHPMRRIGRAGTPPTTVAAGTSRVTTAPAATTAPSPIVTP